MTDDSPMHGRAHPRPLADLPIDALADRADELAGRWASALILARPMSTIGAIPLDDLAREAPSLCGQVLRALESDAELNRLTGNGPATGREELAPARRLGALSGAADPASAVVAAEALRRVIWQALLAELREPPARLLADLADRLAHVCSMALVATIAASSAQDQNPVDSEQEVVVAGADRLSAGSGGSPGARAHFGAERRVVIIDEGGQDPASPGGATRVGESRGATERTLPWDPAPSGPAPGSLDRAQQPPSDPSSFHAPPESRPGSEIRAERVQEGPAAWVGSIGQQLERFATDGRPFAVLLAEVVDIARLVREEPPGEVMRLADQVQRVLEEELRAGADGPPGSLTCEAAGRYWLVVPETDWLRIEALATRLADAVRRSVGHRGFALEVAVGTAGCPEDGQEAAALAAHADVALYAARAGGSARDRATG